MATTNQTLPLETEFTGHHPLVSWRSIVAGLLVSLFAFALMLSLGLAFGGIGLADGASRQGATVFTGLWLLLSSLVALFAGSYFAARISKTHTGRIGSAQGLVIAALFFGLIIYQMAMAVGWLGQTAFATARGVSQIAATGVQRATEIPAVNAAIEGAIGDLNLKSDPQTVATGLASRLIRGDVDSAKTYLAYQAGISQAEADRRIAVLRQRVDQAVVQAREAAARGLQAAGWTIFLTLLIGGAAAISGGALGSMANVRRPLEEYERAAVGLTERHV